MKTYRGICNYCILRILIHAWALMCISLMEYSSSHTTQEPERRGMHTRQGTERTEENRIDENRIKENRTEENRNNEKARGPFH